MTRSSPTFWYRTSTLRSPTNPLTVM
ncbi:MAG: hypothetical protein GYA23_12185 [Methanomicrobiales archaeon]|nr:hypothetical protein [Methanomicrobiales archaeon]